MPSIQKEKAGIICVVLGILSALFLELGFISISVSKLLKLIDAMVT